MCAHFTNLLRTVSALNADLAKTTSPYGDQMTDSWQNISDFLDDP